MQSQVSAGAAGRHRRREFPARWSLPGLSPLTAAISARQQLLAVALLRNRILAVLPGQARQNGPNPAPLLPDHAGVIVQTHHRLQSADEDASHIQRLCGTNVGPRDGIRQGTRPSLVPPREDLCIRGPLVCWPHSAPVQPKQPTTRLLHAAQQACQWQHAAAASPAHSWASAQAQISCCTHACHAPSSHWNPHQMRVS